jgi:RimJ/RimL family protein N-acetyltransferase
VETYNVVFLRDNELILRPFQRDDVSFLTRMVNDPEVTRYLNRFLPMTEVQELAWVESAGTGTRPGVGLMVTVRTEAETRIGTVGLHQINWRDRTAVLGISIGNKNFWGRGYGTRTVRLMADYAFSVLNLRKVCLSVLATNERAIRCYATCGFREEGRLKEQLFRDGAYVDEVHMALFAVDRPAD